ncbi:hypothetical protein T458_12560 [Brevibacillus panacihumi W25]|uniref:Uncharacterized protein n=2 Tax=Brevibacillus panacihumi TaxID=497735 RepID=V6MFM8_9BACL|nr:hypothetical protein T458_12560 [Brevibacillus panacihumi W25]
MPSQDKQNILEELQSFPDQSLAWERSQVILENIREERRRMLKQKRRRKHLAWVTNGLITCAALFAIIWMNPFSSPAKTTGSESVLEQTYFAAAQEAIKAIGMNKNFLFDEMEQDTEYWIVRTTDRQAIVTFKPNTTEVRSVSATYKSDELTPVYQKYVETAQNAMKEANQPVDFQEAHFFQMDGETTFTLWFGDNQFVRVDLKTNQVTDFSIFYNLADVDEKVVSSAKNALMVLAKHDRFAFTQVKKSTTKNEEVWTFSNEQEKYSVEVGAKTGQIYRVKYVTDHYRISSIDEAVTVTKPLVQSLFGVDITGYQAYGGRDWGGYLLKSEGKPTIRINIADLSIGNIAAIGMER